MGPSHTSLEFEIATLAADGSGFSGCVIEKNVKYSGNNLNSKRGINQETCALLCFKKPSCTLWQWKDQVYYRLNFGSEGVRRKRLLSSRSHQHSSSCHVKLQFSMDFSRHRLLPLPGVELHLV